MKITSLNIKNFKSIVDITINEPNPFTVFVGPNGSGKSNIFEALEFANLAKNENAEDIFGGRKAILNFNYSREEDYFRIFFEFPLSLETSFTRNTILFDGKFHTNSDLEIEKVTPELSKYEVKEKLFKEAIFNHKLQLDNFQRIFVGKFEVEKQKINSDKFLSLSASNLEKVLRRLLKDKNTKEEISDWLELFIPEFRDIEVQKSEFSTNEDLLIYQKHYEKPFNKELISDGTYNILCLLTAVYQSDEPQFLCIEEPENGLNPFVIRKLVDFFRQACEEKGHYIWLNTHSQTLVECLTPEELIVVDKVNGETQVKQFKGIDLHGLDMSEVWLSGALGGGTPW